MKKIFSILVLLICATPLLAQDPMIGEIRIFAGNFAPRGWALCEGQLLAISSNEALVSLLGTTYGGDGRTTFGLPDLRGRAPIHPGQGPGLTPRRLGEKGGSETVQLISAEMPEHSHTATLNADSSVAKTDQHGAAFLARNAASTPQFGDSLNTTLGAGAISVQPAGGNQPHPNMQPFLTINYIIASQGIFPSRN